MFAHCLHASQRGEHKSILLCCNTKDDNCLSCTQQELPFLQTFYIASRIIPCYQICYYYSRSALIELSIVHYVTRTATRVNAKGGRARTHYSAIKSKVVPLAPMFFFLNRDLPTRLESCVCFSILSRAI